MNVLARLASNITPTSSLTILAILTGHFNQPPTVFQSLSLVDRSYLIIEAERRISERNYV